MGWVKTFVSHSLTKWALEQHCLKLPGKEKVGINIIATDLSPLRYPTWPVMNALIREVVESSNTSGNSSITLDRAEDVAKKVEQRIHLEKKQHKVLTVFRQMLSSKDPMEVLLASFPSGLHCEFILAAFLLYPLEANPVKDKLLLQIAEVMLSTCHFYPLDNQSSHH